MSCAVRSFTTGLLCDTCITNTKGPNSFDALTKEAFHVAQGWTWFIFALMLAIIVIVIITFLVKFSEVTQKLSSSKASGATSSTSLHWVVASFVLCISVILYILGSRMPVAHMATRNGWSKTSDIIFNRKPNPATGMSLWIALFLFFMCQLYALSKQLVRVYKLTHNRPAVPIDQQYVRWARMFIDNTPIITLCGIVLRIILYMLTAARDPWSDCYPFLVHEMLDVVLYICILAILIISIVLEIVLLVQVQSYDNGATAAVDDLLRAYDAKVTPINYVFFMIWAIYHILFWAFWISHIITEIMSWDHTKGHVGRFLFSENVYLAAKGDMLFVITCVFYCAVAMVSLLNFARIDTVVTQSNKEAMTGDYMHLRILTVSDHDAQYFYATLADRLSRDSRMSQQHPQLEALPADPAAWVDFFLNRPAILYSTTCRLSYVNSMSDQEKIEALQTAWHEAQQHFQLAQLSREQRQIVLNQLKRQEYLTQATDDDMALLLR